MRIGYFLSSEEYGPRELIEQARARRAGGLRRAVDLRPLPPVERRAGPQPLRLVDDRRALQATELPVTTAVTCPTVRIHPGDHRPGRRHQRGPARGPLHARRRHRRGAQRAHPRRPLAEADVRLEMLEEAVELIRTLWQGGQRSHRGRHYTVENARVYDLPDTAAADLRLGLRARRRSSSPRASATASAPPRPTPRRSSCYRSRAAATGPSTPAPRSASARRRRGARDRAPAVAQRGAARRAGPGAAHARALRAGVRARRRQRCSPTPVGPDLDEHLAVAAGVRRRGLRRALRPADRPEQDAFFDRWAAEILPEFAGAATR